jgi:hypothetical protein
LVRDAEQYYQENNRGERTLLSANMLEDPLASVLSSLPTDIARLMIGGNSSDNRVTSEVVSWSTSAQFVTPEVLRVRFGDYAIKIVINQWDVGNSE